MTPADVILAVLGVAAYWAPSITAGVRRVPNTGSVIVVNLFLGWTAVGWVVALAMACRSIPAAQTAETVR
jgi:hypothetical protein